MLADQLDYIIGVDPHRDLHAVAIVEARTGVVVFESTVSADKGGYAEALRLAEQHAPARRGFAVEGTSSYGAGLSRFLADHGEQVFEVSRLRRERRSRGETDALDAVRAARSVLTLKRPAIPRASGEREALRVLMATREGAIAARTAALCQLRDLIVTAPPNRYAASCARLPVPGSSHGWPRRDQSVGRTPSCAAPTSHSKPSLDAFSNSRPKNVSSHARSRNSPVSSRPSYSTSPALGRSWPPRSYSRGHTRRAVSGSRSRRAVSGSRSPLRAGRGSFSGKSRPAAARLRDHDFVIAMLRGLAPFACSLSTSGGSMKVRSMGGRST